jgi:phosphoglycolate phosphatase-like HAD superfamily hydrolase/ADP-ribose pyrophosphatase YjhB (NUDIX family)
VIRNIIFDWSGTLVDDLPSVLAATNCVLAENGVEEMTLDKFRAEFCLPFKHFYDRFTPGVPLEKLEACFHTHFARMQEKVVELPHAREFLQFCRKHKIRTFLLSTVSIHYWAKQAAACGFEQFIDVPYAGVWDKRAKIVELLAENRLEQTETIFIGDMQHDIETAKFGGIGSCAVLTGYNRLEQLRSSEPDVIVEHLGELREILERNRLHLRPVLQEGEYASPNHPIATVGALIWNEAGEVLMVRTQKWSGLWGIPGGKIKFGESSHAALKREIKEETNLDVTDVQFALVQDCIHSREFYRDSHFVLLNYTCRAHGVCDVKLNEESQEYRWLNPGEALKMKLNKPTRILLEHVQNGPNRH